MSFNGVSHCDTTAATAPKLHDGLMHNELAWMVYLEGRVEGFNDLLPQYQAESL
jgi:hypothetical protein